MVESARGVQRDRNFDPRCYSAEILKTKSQPHVPEARFSRSLTSLSFAAGAFPRHGGDRHSLRMASRVGGVRRHLAEPEEITRTTGK